MNRSYLESEACEDAGSNDVCYYNAGSGDRTYLARRVISLRFQIRWWFDNGCHNS